MPVNPFTLFTPPLGCGQISTVRSFRFRYGRVVVRARLPNADWIFPQLLLQPVDNDFGADDYASGQMRVAFATRGQRLQGGVVLGARRPARQLGMCEQADGRWWQDGWHEYSLEWRAGMWFNV